MTDDLTRIRFDTPSEERFVSLRRQLGVTSFGINVLTLQPRQRGRIHRHARQEEVYLVVGGTLTIAVEAVEHELAQGEAARIAPDVRRQLSNRGDVPCVVVALGASGTHESRDGEAFTDWSATEGAPPQEIPLPADLD